MLGAAEVDAAHSLSVADGMHVASLQPAAHEVM